ncbi:MAG: hypothetical protein ACLUUL_02195 [Gemmiger sp.]
MPLPEQVAQRAELIRPLLTITDRAWGRYAFSRDILRDRIPPEQQDAWTEGAIRCGREWAARCGVTPGPGAPDALAARLHLKVGQSDAPMTEKRAVFAACLPDGEILLMQEPLARYREFCAQAAGTDQAGLFPTPEEVRALLLAHEVFHAIEEANESTIYTRTQKLRLWKIFGFANDSTVRAIGEIAAMYFAKELTGSRFNPFLLDPLLFAGYSLSGAKTIVCDIIGIAGKISEEAHDGKVNQLPGVQQAQR